MEWHLDKEIIDFGFTDDDQIVIDWNDGRRSVFDPRPYLEGSMIELRDQERLKTAYLLGHGQGIAWPENLDFGVQLLYNESTTVSSSGPLPPRGTCMTADPGTLVAHIGRVEDGKITVDWSDGTQRVFDVWDHADDDTVEKFVDPAYLMQARITSERDAIAWPDGERFDAKALYERSAIINS